jgi:hypothetical protein
MKCRECGYCYKGYWASSPEAYVCFGAEDPFEITDLNAECTQGIDVNIIKKEIKTYKCHAMCECGGEFFIKDLDVFSSLFSRSINGFEHKCNKCGKIQKFPVTYPKEECIEVE